jgi:hypothetical protein
VGAVDGEDLEIRCVDPANPAGCVCRFAIPGLIEGVPKGREPRFTGRKLVNGSESDPGVVCALALYRAKQITDNRSSNSHSYGSVDEGTDSKEHPAAGHSAWIIDILMFARCRWRIGCLGHVSPH